ncbi:hypothetical protein CLOP_g12919 [Closterium sp. NIES-67]|nr:hypothetical protein CLOP_g12919 [Closterium sp. NIES-67]
MSNPPPSPGSHGTDAGTSCAASSSDELLENSTHAIFKHFKREVRKCEEVGKEEQAAVRAFQTAKVLAREEAHRAEESALDAVSGRGKRKITDYLSDDAQAAKAAADEAICLLFAGLRLPERHADHPLWRNAVRSIARAGTSYVPPKRDYVGGAGLQLCRKRIDEGLTGVMSSWKRHGVTIASDMMTDKCGRPQANVMLVNDTGAVFVESIDCKMEKKTGGYIARLLRPILQKVGVENIVAFCTDGGSNYHSACRLLIAENPRIEHVPCATHVLDLLMEDVGRQAWAKEVVGRASELINYTRSHHWTRQYLRGVDGGKGLQMLRPAGTRFGTQHIAVSRLVELRSTLVTMVLCDAWKAEWAVGPKKAAAETFHDQIMDKDCFGTAEAISDRKLVKEGSYSMEAWWEWHGTDHPLLMALACRVLTQPVSASSCERNWAVWDTVHTARRNRLGSEKCKDLVYVAHNWKVVHNWHMADEGAGVVSGHLAAAASSSRGGAATAEGQQQQMGQRLAS